MPIQIGRPAEHGFDEPLGLLSDCHRRIERFLGAMLIVAKRARGRSLDAGDRDVLGQCRHYFATAGPRHTADEEESLFPRLRASSDERARAALQTLESLEADHREAEQRHARVDALLDRWLAEGQLSDSDTNVLIADLDALHSIYSRHIAVEDQQLFPAAARSLSADDLRAVGREMADRRGVAFPPAGGRG